MLSQLETCVNNSTRFLEAARDIGREAPSYAKYKQKAREHNLRALDFLYAFIQVEGKKYIPYTKATYEAYPMSGRKFLRLSQELANNIMAAV